MPKIECDKPLQVRLDQVIRNAGSPTAAAKLLGLERTMIWRFLKTGRAISKNREALSAALDAHEAQHKENATIQAKNATNESFLQLANLSLEDLQRMRAFFQSMIAVLDCYEKSGLFLVSKSEVSTNVGIEK
ncbi:hypothetical protein PWG14_13420 (plasmid) [Chromobacterium amazonense]|uniref:hypothetical protein n=1 Tax=Chromobacterium amazonense TaxID=1382803 RepID=UPI00237E38E1|nr:hypothetical protein [Chromobacterium amazonense]MDE1713568.1 hypothetical protein [Chromobacterium amazonense]